MQDDNMALCFASIKLILIMVVAKQRHNLKENNMSSIGALSAQILFMEKRHKERMKRTKEEREGKVGQNAKEKKVVTSYAGKNRVHPSSVTSDNNVN
ncbi:unnamed protein product [Sphenostylis stenocarpa]|uniref:Uncharacterized protein n=1 Tax=Sphenostylis stenocarpa TaxID=92480 RepID=A0AA86S561_9FABA|nr:unnamed protein product [Sphenostylis stenocarpa]